MAITLNDALDSPFETRKRLSELPCVVDANVAYAWEDEASYWITLDPLPAFAALGYSREIVRLVLHRASVPPNVYPHDYAGRSWEHRNPDGSLCLWYPRDPVELRWTRDRDVADLVALVQRHLIGEEYQRRNGTWPWEDAPHGDRRQRHPITSDALREVVSDA